MGPILVFGHKNPDNDSICSAVAYAHLKNLTDAENVYVPARLGVVPRETAWVFERFGVALPEEIDHVRTRVLDVMTPEPVTITAEEPMLVAGPHSREPRLRRLPVCGAGGRAPDELGGESIPGHLHRGHEEFHEFFAELLDEPIEQRRLPLGELVGQGAG